jgi:uncharacterized membrane protein YhhN
LIAHIFYILFFLVVRSREKLRSNLVLLIIVLFYYVSFISFLGPYLGEMKMAVRIYGIVISYMFMLAMHMLFLDNRLAGRLMMAGAALFVVSDSVLAINKFYREFTLAGPLIMITYGFAQLLIVEGVINYLRPKQVSDIAQNS